MPSLECSIVREMNQKSVRVEFRRPPHGGFGAHDFLQVANQRGTVAGLFPQRMDHHVISFSVNLEFIVGPVRRDLSRRVSHDVPIRKLKFALVLLLGPAIDDVPTPGRIDRQGHWILFVIDDVHEEVAAVEIRMTRIELRKSAGQIVGKNFVAEHQGRAGGPETSQLSAPGLIVHARHREIRSRAIKTGGTCFAGLNFLNILGKIKNGITARRPFGHLKIQRLWSFIPRPIDSDSDFNRDFKQMRTGLRHCQPVFDLKRAVLGQSCDAQRQEQQTYGRRAGDERSEFLHEL